MFIPRVSSSQTFEKKGNDMKIQPVMLILAICTLTSFSSINSKKKESSSVLGVSEMHGAVALAVTKFNAHIALSKRSIPLDYRLTGVSNLFPHKEFNMWVVRFSPVNLKPSKTTPHPVIILGGGINVIVDIKTKKCTITFSD